MEIVRTTYLMAVGKVPTGKLKGRGNNSK